MAIVYGDNDLLSHTFRVQYTRPSGPKLRAPDGESKVAAYDIWRANFMAQMTPEVSKLLEQALSLSVEEQEALADSLISNLGGKVDEGVQAAWDEEIKRRIEELDSGKAKTIPWEEVRERNLRKLPRAH
jgi:putative addiction module component (TIGR02574 family)